MTNIFEAIKRWPKPAARSLPFKVVTGRRWTGVALESLPDTLGKFFDNTEATAIRIRVSRTNDHRVDLEVLGTGCPAVPYATIDGDKIKSFIRFVQQGEFDLWVHSECWFWLPDLDDENLESIVDRFISSVD